jgi:DnaJ-class molecular chaperone
MFQKIQAAYAVISDPIARAAYDRRRPAARATTTGESPAASASARSAAEERKSAPASPPPAAKQSAFPRRTAPGVMLGRLSGPLSSLLACGAAEYADDDVIELFLSAEEAAQGGMVTISMRVPVRCTACAGDETASCTFCGGARSVEELFSAWLAIPPDVTDGALLQPSALLPGMLHPVSFRVRVRGAT